MAKRYTPTSAAADVEAALRLLEGRWKLVILFHLFGGKVLRFSDLEKAIPAISQKMLLLAANAAAARCHLQRLYRHRGRVTSALRMHRAYIPRTTYENRR